MSRLSEERLQATGDVHSLLNYCKWTAHRVEVVSKPKIVYAFLYRYCDSKTKIQNTFLLFSVSVWRILYFCVKKYKKLLLRANSFSLKRGQYGCQNIQNCMPISDLEEHLRRNAPKKDNPEKLFFQKTISRSNFTVFQCTFPKYSFRSTSTSTISIKILLFSHSY